MPSTLSLYSIRIVTLNELDASPLARATGFFCRYRSELYFLTNWHVVTGRNPNTNRSKTGARPNKLQARTFIAKPDAPLAPGQKEIAMKTTSADFELSLLSEDGDPLWKEHPEYGQKVDVIALKLDESFDVDGIQAYKIEDELARLRQLSVMAKVFIVGFPLDESQTNSPFPIYKGATIASEPTVHNKEPRIHLDSKTNPGMSGSPVVCEHKDDIFVEDGKIMVPTVSHTLVGMYAGRDGLAEDEHTAELGRMYPISECILPILESFRTEI